MRVHADNWGVSRQLGAKLDYYLINSNICYGLLGSLLSFNLNTHISKMLVGSVMVDEGGL